MRAFEKNPRKRVAMADACHRRSWVGITAAGMLVSAMMMLAGCGNHAGNTASINLQITSWGPETTRAGVPFNKQPDGSAALWVRLNQSLDGDVAAIEFNGVPLQGNVSGNLVTAGVPADLYAALGSYKVHVIARSGKLTMQSNDVTFTVE